MKERLFLAQATAVKLLGLNRGIGVEDLDFGLDGFYLGLKLYTDMSKFNLVKCSMCR